MAKNKSKGQKQKSVFQIANKPMKKKNKAKSVTTSLKHINAMKNEKVDSLNKIFTDVQCEMQSVSKCTADKEPKHTPQVAREPPGEAANVDSAAQLLSQL
ncbi:uncharacterized protein rbis [Brienomyrus brachyistius]|uniref:uncharacterized protein rbis n=1 Tax=Brienomyrus brachyistius TaxID=42636 RepID=UPI0020B274D9|nr:uncharacterized protein rbis [Brienomyrus brachyistius]